MGFRIGANFPGGGHLHVSGGRSRRRRARRWQHRANHNARVAQKLGGKLQRARRKKRRLKMENTQLRAMLAGGGPSFNNYGNVSQSFSQNFLQDPTALMSRNGVNAFAQLTGRAGKYDLGLLANHAGGSTAVQANLGNARALMAYRHAALV